MSELALSLSLSLFRFRSVTLSVIPFLLVFLFFFSLSLSSLGDCSRLTDFLDRARVETGNAHVSQRAPSLPFSGGCVLRFGALSSDFCSWLLISEGKHSPQSPTIPLLEWRHATSRWCAVECKMATAILAQGNRLEDSGAILRPIEGDKRSRSVHTKRNQSVTA